MLRSCSVRKYLSIGRWFTVMLPVPVARRTRATAVLRRPVAQMYCFVAAGVGVGSGIDLQLLRFLRLVRMLAPLVDLQLEDHAAPQPVTRKHVLDGVAHHLVGMLREPRLERDLDLAARVSREPLVLLLLRLLPRKPDLVGVDDDD